VHEIRTIQGDVAALGELAIPKFVPRRPASGSARSLTVVSKYLSAGGGELFPMLLKAAQHGEITLIQHRAAVPLGISRTSALLQIGTAVLRHGSTEKKKRQRAGDKEILDHWNLYSGL
jgi:hypothetical protein